VSNVDETKKAAAQIKPGTIPDADSFSNAEEHAAWIRSQTRKPFGSYQQKLAYAKRQGYYRHWFNDEPGRVEAAIAHGYAHVKEQGKPVKRPVGTAKQGGVLYAFLLEIPEVIWREDKAAEQEEVTRLDRSIREGKVANKPGDGIRPQDGDKFYTPKEGIHVREGGRGKSGL
jgi:hypothetical protein